MSPSRLALAGLVILRGRFRPTEKNAPARDVFARHGFEQTAETADGAQWELDLMRHSLSPPEWIEVTPAP